MRPSVLRLIAAVLVTASAASPADAAVHKPVAKPPAKHITPPPPDPPPPPPPPPPDPADHVMTSDDAKSSSVRGAVTTPLRDFNVVKTKIPPVLLAALTDPYERPPAKWKCSQLIALIQPLNAALGLDIDQLPPGDENLMDRGRSTALGAAADFASDAIPFRGWVRKLSGAEAHDKLVQSAIIAGNVRRGYLKGLGEARGCPPPGTPSHERAGSEPAEDVQRPPSFKPKFPIHESDATQTSGGTPRAAPPR